MHSEGLLWSTLLALALACRTVCAKKNPTYPIVSYSPRDTETWPVGQQVTWHLRLAAAYEVTKLKISVTQVVDNSKQSQKLKMKPVGKTANRWKGKLKSDLVEGEACYKIKVELNGWEEKKLQTEPICFQVVQDVTSSTTAATTSLLDGTETSHTLPTTRDFTTTIDTSLWPNDAGIRALWPTAGTLVPSRKPVRFEVVLRVGFPVVSAEGQVSIGGRSEVFELKRKGKTRKWFVLLDLEAGHACYSLQITFKNEPTRKVETDQICFTIRGGPGSAEQQGGSETESTETTTVESSILTESTAGTTTTEQQFTTTMSTTSVSTVTTAQHQQYDLEVTFVTDNTPRDFRFSIVEQGAEILGKGISDAASGTHLTKIESGTQFCFYATDEAGNGGTNYWVTINGVLILHGNGRYRFTSGPSCFSIGQDGKANPVGQPTSVFCEAMDPQNFNLCFEIVDLSNGLLQRDLVEEDFRSAFVDAKQTWQRVLDGDDGVTHNASSGLLVDDMYIEAAASMIDGPGGVLGYAGPYEFWTDEGGRTRPFAGVMAFDATDIQMLVDRGLLSKVIEHEVAHVLGLGGLWSTNGLYDYVTYKGVNANREYRKILAQAGPVDGYETVPIELDGNNGTRYGHWDEACFQGEIATGWLNFITYFSTITVGGLQDLGYLVNYGEADPFTISNYTLCKSLSGTEHPVERRKLLRDEKGKDRNADRTTPIGSRKQNRWRMLHGKRGETPNPAALKMASEAGQNFLKSQDHTQPLDDVIDVLWQDGLGNIFSIPVSYKQKQEH